MAGRAVSVDEYIESQPEPARAALRCVRDAIRKALPDAQETIAYGMPAYRIDGAPVLHFAAWKRHLSLYGASEAVVREFESELRDCRIEKGTIAFPLDRPMPAALIARIARFRAMQLLAKS